MASAANEILCDRLQVVEASKELRGRRANAVDTAYSMAQDGASFLESLKRGHGRVRRRFGKVGLVFKLRWKVI